MRMSLPDTRHKAFIDNHGGDIKRLPFLLCITFIALIFCGMLVYATHWGLWAGSDSAEYYQAARNLALGKGLVIVQASGEVHPLHLRPPLYSILMALPVLLHLDMLSFNRGLYIVLAAGFPFLLAGGVCWVTRDRTLGLAFALLGTFLPVTMNTFSGAMSEPLSLVLGLCGLFILLRHIQQPGLGWLLLAGILLGLAFLARFAAAAFLAAAGVSILLLSSRSFVRRLIDGFLLALIGVLPFGTWYQYVWRSGFSTGTLDRVQAPLWQILAPFRLAVVDHAWRWFNLSLLNASLDYRWQLLILFLFTVIFVGLIAKGFSHLQRKGYSLKTNTHIRLFHALTLFLLGSVLILVVTYIFVAIPKPALNMRLFSAIEIFILFSVLCLGATFLRLFLRRQAALIGILLLSIVIVLPKLPATWSMIDDLHTNGRGYTNKRNWHSPLLAEIDALPSGIPLISNDPDLILFWTGRPAYGLPDTYLQEQTNDTLPFGSDESSVIQIVFSQQDAALALFQTIYVELNPIHDEQTEVKVEAMLDGLDLKYDGWDGKLIFYP